MYQWLKYNKMDGLEFVSKNCAINEDKKFRIPSKTGHLVLLKRTSGALNSSCYNQSKVVYNSKNLIKKAIEKGKKEEVVVQGKTYPEILSYRGMIGQQYVVVYCNNHESLSLKVLIKFKELKNLRIVSKTDKANGFWSFIVNPGQIVIRKLHPINPFEGSEIRGMSTELFIVEPKKTREECQKDLETPKQWNRDGQNKTTISRGKENRGMNSNINNQRGLSTTCNNIGSSPDSLSINGPIFDVGDSFTLEKLINGDCRSNSNFKFGINQKILKLMKQVDPARYSSITTRTSYKFEKK